MLQSLYLGTSIAISWAWGTSLASGEGLFLTLLMFLKGLKATILTDLWQCIALILTLLGVGSLYNVFPEASNTISSSSDRILLDNLLLLVVVIGVTTSTIDSIAVALHRDFGRKLGTLIGLGICVGYGLLLELSVLSIWSYFGVIRVGLALYILYWCYKHEINSRTINNGISPLSN